MAKAPVEEPAGLVYRADVLARDQERELLARFATLRFDPIVMHGQPAKRTARHYGLDYDYQSRAPIAGEPLPEWLLGAREHAAELSGLHAEELVEALVQRYPPGAAIGWHRDAPAFGLVIGLSLRSECRLRLQRGKREERRVWELLLEPRSGYVLAGQARVSWQHSIPPTQELRYSITFRTLRQRPTERAESPSSHRP